MYSILISRSPPPAIATGHRDFRFEADSIHGFFRASKTCNKARWNRKARYMKSAFIWLSPGQVVANQIKYQSRLNTTYL